MAEPVPPPSPRQAMLAQLADALSVLGDKMRAQQQAAIDVCAMGTRAEEIARSTRTLAFDRRLGAGGGLRALSGELDEFADEMLATAERVQQDSLLGRAVARGAGRPCRRPRRLGAAAGGGGGPGRHPGPAAAPGGDAGRPADPPEGEPGAHRRGRRPGRPGAGGGGAGRGPGG